jgi:hypothetical protein
MSHANARLDDTRGMKARHFPYPDVPGRVAVIRVRIRLTVVTSSI